MNTPATTIALPSATRAVNGSSSSPQPTSTATTGVAYAISDSPVTEWLASSQ